MVRATRRLRPLLGMMLATTLGLAGTARADEPPLDAKATFTAMKGLVGTWEGDMQGQKFQVVYRLVANGSALVEDQFPGTPHEMVTVYHLDGDDLRMTHYCAAGNQPHTKLDRKASTATELHFAFDGGTNLDPAKDSHMHEMTMRLTAPDKIVTEWTGYKDGKPGDKIGFELTRAEK